MRKVGVHSEVGKLRTVMVCRPSLAHQRLTPGNCRQLLFDDVIWVHEAQKDHHDFVLKMQERGVEVLELHELLAETLEQPEARRFVLDRLITPNSVGFQNAAFIRPWLDEMPADKAGGSSDRRNHGLRPARQASARRMMEEAFGGAEFVLPPIPNTLFQRDPSCWIYGGVTCNPMYWPARKPETLLQRAIYKFHPSFRDGDFKIWWGDSDEPLRQRVARRWRRHADRQRRRADRAGRAHDPSGRGPGGPASSFATRPRRGVIGVPDAEEPGGHASRYRVHLLRSRPRHRYSRRSSTRSAATASIRSTMTGISKCAAISSRC